MYCFVEGVSNSVFNVNDDVTGPLYVRPYPGNFGEFIYFSFFEQAANISFFRHIEYTFSIWSNLYISDFFVVLFLYLLWTPIIFAFFILITYM